MSVLLWVGIATTALVGLAMGARAIDAARWSALVLTHTAQLESRGAQSMSRLPAPARFDAHELEGLPAPVRRYFRTGLTDGQPIVASVTIDMTGRMNMSATAEQWKPFTSRQRVDGVGPP